MKLRSMYNECRTPPKLLAKTENNHLQNEKFKQATVFFNVSTVHRNTRKKKFDLTTRRNNVQCYMLHLHDYKPQSNLKHNYPTQYIERHAIHFLGQEINM